MTPNTNWNWKYPVIPNKFKNEIKINVAIAIFRNECWRLLREMYEGKQDKITAMAPVMSTRELKSIDKNNEMS